MKNNKETSVDPRAFLGNKTNSADIYSYGTKNRIYSPFNFRIESPEKLILFDFKGHSRYKFLECQFYNDTVFVLWNKNFNGEIVGLKDDNFNKNVPVSYEVVENSKYIEIRRILYNENGHTTTMNFSPALPELLCLKENINLEGRFTIDVDEKEGVIGGEYFINRNGKVIELKLQPTKGWQPLPGKSWVKNHFLDIHMEETENGNVLLDSKWRVNE